MHTAASRENHEVRKQPSPTPGKGCCHLLQRGLISEDTRDSTCAWGFLSGLCLLLCPLLPASSGVPCLCLPLDTALSRRGSLCQHPSLVFFRERLTVKTCLNQTPSLWLPFDPPFLPGSLQAPGASLTGSLLSFERPILLASPERWRRCV